MLEELHCLQRTLKGTGVKTEYGKQDFQRQKTYSRVDTKVKSALRTGNHVLALPYSSTISSLDVVDVPQNLVAYAGTVYESPTSRLPRDTDWPWPPLPYRTSVTSYVARADWTFNGTQFLQLPDLVPPVGTIPEWESLVKLADTKALGNLRKALFNLPMIIAERRETIQMMGGKVALMAKGVKALQTKSTAEYNRTPRKNRKRVANRIANEHLEFVFGWLPLISEVEGLVDLVEKDQLDFIRSRGVQVLQKSGKRVTAPLGIKPPWATTYFNTSLAWGSVETRLEERSLIGVRTALRYKLSSKLVGDAYAIGFEPISTLFDLVPLSFITGWVSNFDYWIRTLAPEIGIEFETGSRNRRKLFSYHAEGRFIPTATRPLYGRFASTTANGMVRRDDREVLYEAPSASLHWDVEVGLYEVTAGASLAIQRYLKPLKLAFKQKQFRYKGPRPEWLKEIRYTGRT